MNLSERAQAIKPSPTLAVTARAAALRAEGKDIIGLGAGEPDFDTPEHIREAGKKALDDGFTRYTAVDGRIELKQAIIAKFSRDNGLDYAPEQIIVSCGAKHSIYNLMQALLNPGDEVLIPAPYWVSYPDMSLLAGAKPVVIEAGIEQGFKITPAQLEAAITPRSRLLFLNSPSNPTGVCYTPEEMAALGEVLLAHPNIIIASDDIYEHILWEGGFCNIVMACPELYDRTVVINGVSKVYAMTGWRIGYAACNADLVKGMKKIQSQSTSNPTTMAQLATEAALNGDQSFVAPMAEVFEERHAYVLKRLNQLKGVRCLPAQGAFYAFPEMSEAIAALDGVANDVALAEHFIEHAGVAMVPGSAFGAAGYMRISYATSMDKLTTALDRIESVLGTK